jgi:hypothetical protein
MNPKTKKIIIWAVVLIILGVIAYFAWKKWQSSKEPVISMPATPQQALDGNSVAMPLNTVSTNSTPTVAPPVVTTVAPKVLAYKKGNNQTYSGPTSGTGTVTQQNGL